MVIVEKLFTFKGHSDSVYALEEGKVEGKFYSSGGDGNVVEWDINDSENGKLIAKVSASVYSLCLVPDKNILIVGQNYEGIHLIDLESHKELGSLRLTTSAIFDIKCIEDTAYIATGDGVLYVVDFRSLQIKHELAVCDQNLRNIFILDNQKLLIASSDGCIRTYGLKDFKLLQTLSAHDNSVFTLMKRKDHPMIISGGRDAKLKYWKVEESLNLEESINAHMYAINDLALRPDGEYFATASMDKTIKIWDFAERKLIKVIDKARHDGHLTSVNKVLWLNHKDTLVSCSDDRSIGIWRINIKK